MPYIDKFDINLFTNINENDIDKSINDIFSKILLKIQSYLNLKPVSSTVKFVYKKNDSKTIYNSQNIFDLGTNRHFVNDDLYVEIFEEYKKFLPIILLREVYNCFIPINLKNNDAVNVFINQIVENDLSELNAIKEWKSLVRSRIVNVEFLSSHFDRLEKFLKLKGGETTESAVKFFLKYIRKNVIAIDNREVDFYDKVFKEFVYNTADSLKNDDIVETIRILIEIFYRVKSYRALLEYQDYFKKFKENGTIQTDLSLNKFITNVRWINNYSYIGPSYQLNLKAIDLALIKCNLQFNPLLTKAKIDLVVEKLPFFVDSRYSLHNFAIEVSGWFIVPRIYIKDLRALFKSLEQCGYIINMICMIPDFLENNLNLNYFREFYKKGRIINPYSRKYDKKYEIRFALNYSKDFRKQELSILEFLVIDRVKNWSITGFGFQRREETLRNLKSDLFNETFSQRTQIFELKNNLNVFHEDQTLKTSFLRFLEIYQKYGFFRVKELLENLFASANLIEKFLIENRNVNSFYQLQEIVKKGGISQILDENLLLNDNEIRKILFRDLIPIYFDNNTKYNEEIRRYRAFTNFFKSCYNLKIFDFNSIKYILRDKTTVEKIYSKKEIKLKRLYESRKIKNVTHKDVENILDEFSNKNPPIIKPILISTISTNSFAPFYIQIIIKDVPEIQVALEKLKVYFPRFIINRGIDFFTEDNLIYVEIHLPSLNKKEKGMLVSIFCDLFKTNLMSVKLFFWDGFLKAFSRKDFYNFEEKEFFYTQDLFPQFFIYVQNVFRKNFVLAHKPNKIYYDQYMSSEGSITQLVNKIEQRTSDEHFEIDIDNINELVNFHTNLKDFLIDLEQFKKIKENNFYKNNIKSIKFKPSFQSFGFGFYYLYIRPIDMNDIDFKLLLTNTFLSVKSLANVDKSSTFIIKYLFPYKNPNMSYLNWLSQSKKNVSEYCLFLVKKIHQLFRFDTNISPNGWDLDPGRFKTHAQNVLFDPDYNVQVFDSKEFSIREQPVSEKHGPESRYFEHLTKIYSRKPIDIKSILSVKNHALIEAVTELIRKDLILPYINLKNLDLIEKILILLPDMKNETTNKILQIFSFFNFGFIYEIEGEYFIFDNPPKIKKFEQGLLIKLYLPSSTDYSEFYRIFNKLFRYLKIKKFLIWQDLIDGSNIIKSTFGNLSFLDRYQPLTNLKWNKDDKIWANHKLFNEKFDPIYPNLMIEEKSNNF